MFDGLKKIYNEVRNAFSNDEERSEESHELLITRRVGETMPVSIATAQVVENESADIDRWNQLLLINIHTLARNVLGAVEYKEKKKIKVDDLIDILINEMNILMDILPSYRPGTQVEFYLPDYRDIGNAFKMAKHRLYQTDNLKFEWIIHYKTQMRLAKMVEEKKLSLPIRVTGWQLEKDRRPTTLLTSYPTDLLSQYQFPKMNLLESHTGKVKERKDWYTKLNGARESDLSNIPFCKFTIAVFGDGVFFLVSHTKVKSLVKQMAVRDRWNYITTDSKIKGSISKITHPEDRKALMEFFN